MQGNKWLKKKIFPQNLLYTPKAKPTQNFLSASIKTDGYAKSPLILCSEICCTWHRCRHDYTQRTHYLHRVPWQAEMVLYCLRNSEAVTAIQAKRSGVRVPVESRECYTSNTLIPLPSYSWRQYFILVGFVYPRLLPLLFRQLLIHLYPFAYIFPFYFLSAFP
jgi:hypothetical protein